MTKTRRGSIENTSAWTRSPSGAAGRGNVTGSRLVIGAGATGRTHLLTSWAQESADEPTLLTGSPLAPITADEVAAALESSPDLLVIDDLQWCEAEALAAVATAARSTTVYASRRPTSGTEADAEALELVGELLTRTEPAHRLGLLDVEAFASALAHLRNEAAQRQGEKAGGALATEEVDRLHAATAGSAGFAADAVANNWNGDLDAVSAGLTDAVNSRIRRAGKHAARLVALWATLGADGSNESLSTALGALAEDVDPSVAEREARAGGLVADDGSLIPIVTACAGADMTEAERANLHDRLAQAMANTDPMSAADHLLVGSGEVDNAAQILASAAMTLAVTEPRRAPAFIDRAEHLGLPASEGSLLRALSSFHAGAPDALAHLDAAHTASEGATDDRSAVLGYGIDNRDLRFESAADRPITGDLAEPLQGLALGLAGKPVAPGDTSKLTPLSRVMANLSDAVHHLAEGSSTEAIGSFSTAADDYDRLRPTAPFGVTPHTLGALAALVIGDLSVVEILTTQALEQSSGGSGEALTHRLVQAYGRLIGGDYGDALAVLREHAIDVDGDGSGEAAPKADDMDDLEDLEDDADASNSTSSSPAHPTLLSQRDRLLLASLEAAIARRSGDTGRLRSAWRRAEEALIRPSATWLLADPFAELLAAGARLGDTRRVEPIVEQLLAQGVSLPATGPGPVAGHWLRMQIAIASEDAAGVHETAKLMAELQPSDERSRIRIEAAGIWSKIMGHNDPDIAAPAEEEVVGVAERLSAVGDGWEASRLLGQAALDEPDAKAARRMLELARISASEHVDESSGEGLSALGLSERESEVALLVVEGRTHKEVGAQLFISPKTVEHHVAKIRQKVGASSRAELLSIIREAVGNL